MRISDWSSDVCSSDLLRHKESHQNMDVVSMFNPITKWRWSILNADVIPELVRRAFKISIEEKAGAVHLELPEDIAKNKSDIKPIKKIERASCRERVCK